jgi:hypothetical protein
MLGFSERRRLKLEYDKTIPRALRKLIAERVSAVTHLFPGWVNKLIVAYDGSDKDVATVKPEYEYRFVTITLHRAFIEQDDWYESLVHEVAHSLVRPYVALVDRIVEAFVPENSKGFVYDELAKAEEAMVEDLAIFSDKVTKANGEGR